MHRRRLIALLLAAIGLPAVLPEAALAHGLVGRQDLPIPAWLFLYAAVVVLIVSFVALAILWRDPRLENAGERRVAALPRILDPICGAIGVALFVLVLYAGFAGSETTTNNLAPTFVFVLFWVGLAVVSPIFGDVFKALNPWRAIARAVAGIAAKLGGDRLPAPLAYPAAAGRWPAAIGILAFAWVELVYSGRGDPGNLAVLALVYAAIQWVGMSLYGIETWNRNADGFAVYYGLLARISPLHWTRAGLYVRRPLSGLTQLEALPGTVALTCVIIGTTSFDGLTGGELWQGIASGLTDFARAFGLGQANGLQFAYTIGLVTVVLVVAGAYRLGIMGVEGIERETGGKRSVTELATRFAHSLVPIALAYIVAHYFSLLAYEGQRVVYLASDPLGTGDDLLGTAGTTVDYTWIGANAIWYVQVAVLVAGHVAGLILAHDRALVTFEDRRAGLRSQYWMLAVMVAFTTFAMLLLSAANS